MRAFWKRLVELRHKPPIVFEHWLLTAVKDGSGNTWMCATRGEAACVLIGSEDPGLVPEEWIPSSNTNHTCSKCSARYYSFISNLMSTPKVWAPK